MRFVLSLALVTLPTTVLAEDGGRTEPVVATDSKQGIIGGSVAVAGKWPDAAALLWGGEQGCTGTLIAPTLVLTAGHCVEDGRPGSVIVGAISEISPQGGETIRVLSAFEYPASQSTIDAAVLVLQTPAVTKPRAIATGWARFDITNGAAISLVGFGTTDRNGNIDSPNLMEAVSTITDANCTKSSGCNSGARPDGELGAGGNGIDTCPGDSGGPLYLNTPYGSFVAGITSRGYDNNSYYCSEGGIYGRADKVVDWIEMVTQVKVEKGPAPTADLLSVVRGNPGETPIEANDPRETAHTFAVVKQPEYGRAAVSEGGILRVCANGDVIGGDSVTVSVTDAADPTRTLQLDVGIVIEDGDPDGDCDPTAFGDDGGCCDTRRSAKGSLPLVLFVALVLRRRRRAPGPTLRSGS
jgi:endonuclease G